MGKFETKGYFGTILGNCLGFGHRIKRENCFLKVERSIYPVKNPGRVPPPGEIFMLFQLCFQESGVLYTSYVELIVVFFWA